jgi:hypothetical protein
MVRAVGHETDDPFSGSALDRGSTLDRFDVDHCLAQHLPEMRQAASTRAMENSMAMGDLPSVTGSAFCDRR